MKLHVLSEDIRGYDAIPELKLLLDAINENLVRRGIEPIIIVRSGGEEANIFVNGDRRSGLTIRTGMDGTRNGDNWRYYRAERRPGATEAHSKDPMEILTYVINVIAGRRQAR